LPELDDVARNGVEIAVVEQVTPARGVVQRAGLLARGIAGRTGLEAAARIARRRGLRIGHVALLITGHSDGTTSGRRCL
jgi:hypothetical protein